MSLSQHLHDYGDRRRHARGGGRRGHAAAGEAEAEALDLLDEYWFFSNMLVKNGRERRPPPLPKSPSTSGSCGDRMKGQGAGAKGGSDRAGTSRFYESGCRRILRTPSLASPLVGMGLSKDEDIVLEEEAAGDQGVAEVEDDDLNWSSIYEGVLRTRIAEGGGSGGRSALHRAPSMPVPSSATTDDNDRRGKWTAAAATKSTPSMSRLRHSYSTMERHCRSHTPTKTDQTARTSGGGERGHPRRELRSFSANQQPAILRHKSAFQDKKSKGSSDLESIEVQGFKDLGFVFDQEELRESLVDVLPGLRGKTKAPSCSGNENGDVNGNGNGSGNACDGRVRRPYQSEAWHHYVRRPAPSATIRLQQADARSAAEMKNQIRMWAQAVACNVRQES